MLTLTRARIARILGPSLAIAVLTILLTSCSSSAEGQPTGVDSSSASSPDAVSSGASESSSSTTPSPEAAIPSQPYADGTFAATGTYTSPGGPESVNVTLTLKGGVITDATFEGTATMGKSKMFQERFSEGFREVVVGKSIDGLHLTVVNGSSLTPMGFMEAVGKIKAEA